MSKGFGLLESAARVLDAQSRDVNVPDGPIAFYLDVTAVAGIAPTLDVDIEAKDEISGKYFVLDSFAQATGVTQERIALAAFPDTAVRLAYTIGGTTEAVTFTNATNLVDSAGTAFTDNDVIRFELAGGTLPAELSLLTDYHVITDEINSFQVALTQGGAAVTFTDDGTTTVNAVQQSVVTFAVSIAV